MNMMGVLMQTSLLREISFKINIYTVIDKLLAPLKQQNKNLAMQTKSENQ